MSQVCLPSELATAHLTLRPYCAADIDDVLSYATDRDWSRYLPGVPFPYERPHALEFLAQQAQVDRAENPSWALVFESHVVGGINIRFDANYSDAAMGWSVAPRLWGRGFATEAARVVIDAAFRAHLTLQRIAAAAHPENLASFRVMEKIGMHRQGAQQNARLSRGASADQARYLPRSDWESRT